ncbi:hypothetical protein [Sideroxydans sp.]
MCLPLQTSCLNAQKRTLYTCLKCASRNQELACAFPVTYSYIEDGNLRLLLKNKELWKQSVEQDLLTMVSGYAGENISHILKFVDLANRYIETAQYLGLEYQGEFIPLTEVPISADSEFKKLNSGFYDGVIELDIAIRSLKDILSRSKNTRAACSIPAMTLEDLSLLADNIKQAKPHLQAWANHIKANGKLLKLNTEKIKSDCQDDPNHYHCKFINSPPQEWLQSDVEIAIGATAVAVTTAVALKDFANKIKATNTYAAKVLVAEKFMKQTGFSKAISNPERLSNDLMFFAELADTDANSSKEQVEEILMRYTLPPVTFGVKRESQTHLMITGHLAASYGNVINSSEVSGNNRAGIYAPVGLELSHGLESGSLSLMIAPFDFGYPISLKLNGIEQGVSLNEVVAPSIALSYGWRDYPLSVGVAYQRGRRSSLTNAVEKRAMIFMGIDMPLFLFY